MCAKYNGWTNWETWNLKLWLDNEEPVYNQVLLLANTYPDQMDFIERLKEFVESIWFPELPAGPMADAVNSYLCTVDWYEITESYHKEVNP